jgi:glutamyl-tRNA synthetase
VGGARTAYFNWLLARQNDGQFVLRVEDTDADRSTDESEKGVMDDLRWLGLDWDEGPDVGGPYGPYRQSERLDRYRVAVELLVSRGAAYPCFCTDEELAERRAQALADGRPPHYDGSCRHMSAAEREKARKEGRPESVRFTVEAREWVLKDLVRDEVRFPPGMVGDFVILRSNGHATYNFACVVDDAAMRISHVIRAEEHLPNTARQLMLFDALGETPPQFAHVPLILNADRTKMSKREGEAAVAVGDWRRAGYAPEGLLSYLALLGFHTADEREILSRAEMLEAFTLDRVGRSGSVFDPDRLNWTNAQTLHHADGATLRAWGESFLPSAARALPTAELEALLELVRGNLMTLADIPAELAPFLDDTPAVEPEAADSLRVPEAQKLLGELAADVERLAEWSGQGFKSALLARGKQMGLKGRNLFLPVRAALTGRTHGPELPHVAERLGQSRSVARLRAAAEGR